MNGRIFVTGMGAVSALGRDVASNWRAVVEGRSAIGPHLFDSSAHGPPPVTLPAALPEPGFEQALESRMGRRISGSVDRFALLALCAAFEALDHAGLIEHPALARRTALVFGHGQGGQQTLEKSYERFFGLKSPRSHPASVPRIMVSGAVSAAAMQFGVKGPVFATSSACASSAHAIIQGAGLIRSGLADVAVVGGSEAIATPGCMSGWQAIEALALDTCRPFSRGRAGMVMGEGGAVLVLESEAHALGRGATPLGEYLGGGMSSDAFHITQPALEGASSSIAAAREAAGLQPGEPVLIAAHGTGTPLNDSNEAAALRQVFGGRAEGCIVTATKSAHGHLIGGSAALQAVLSLKALEHGLAPPVLNYLAPDEACDLDLVLGCARPIEARKALVNAFAFGGLNATLAFGGARR